MKKYTPAAICGLFLISFSSHGGDRNFIFDSGLHFGGDRLATVHNSNGKTQDIKAGQLLSIAGGYRFDLSESLEMPVTIGLKTDTARINNGDDGEVSFDRYPLNILLLYKSSSWRVGGGLTYHINPEYKEETNYYTATAEFENALGLLAELRYYFTDMIYMGARYTKIEYQQKNDPTGHKFDGSSTGLIFGLNL